MLRGRLSATAALLATILVECALVVCGYQLYSRVRVLVAGRRGAALAHGALTLRFERWLHLSFEQPVQHTALRALWLVRICDYYYVYMYLPFIAGTAVVLFLRDRRIYSYTRRTFLISGAIGLVVFAQFPVAPPRLLPNAGFIDTIQRFFPEAGYASNHFANQYAAVPSFHVAWSALAAIALWRVVPWRPMRALIALVPLAMLLVVVVTANHLWIDAVIGGLVIGLAGWLARQIDALLAGWLRFIALLQAVVRTGRLPDATPRWPALPLCYVPVESVAWTPAQSPRHEDDGACDRREQSVGTFSVRRRGRRQDRSQPRCRRRS